jgi:hypothetical protein
MTQKMLHDIGSLPLPADCTATQLLQRRNCETVLEMVLQEKARRLVAKVMYA